MLAAQAHGDDRGEAAHNEAVRVDQHPILLDLGGLGRSGLAEHVRFPSGGENARLKRFSQRIAAYRAAPSPPSNDFYTPYFEKVK